MSNIPIRDMTQTGTPDASSYIVFDNGTMRKGLVGDLADGVRPVASQGEAEAGANNTKTMTPLRVKQSIASEIGVSIASKAQGDLANTALQSSSLASGVLSFLTTPTSANLRTALTDETGTGAAVFATSPNITTPTGIVKGDVGLGNVDNTSDATKWTAAATFTNKTFDTAGAGNSFSINGVAVTANTGTGAVVRATSPTLVTPNLGTPSAVTLTNATGLPIATGVANLGTGVATSLAVNIGTAGSPVVNGGALGTPSSGTATNITGLPVATGISGLGTGVATFLATPSSANLAAALTDETGTGSAVFANAPTLVNPVVGTQSPGNNTTLAASTAFVTAAVTAGVSGVSSLNGQTGTLALYFSPQGRITLTSATPVMSTSVAAAATVYYTPYAGDIVPIYNGSNMVPTVFTQLSQTTTDTTKSPAAVAASKNYDLFVWNDSGTIRCTRGPAWTNNTTRGYTFTMVNGILLNTSAITNGPAASRGTWVGTIASNGSSTIDFIFGGASSGGTASALMVWNAYNRVTTATIVEDSGAAYTYSSTTVRQARASAGNQISFLVGAVEDGVWVNYAQTAQTSTGAGAIARFGVGLNNTAAYIKSPSMVWSIAASASGQVMTLSNGIAMSPPLGVNVVSANESADGTAQTFNNALATGVLSAMIRN